MAFHGLEPYTDQDTRPEPVTFVPSEGAPTEEEGLKMLARIEELEEELQLANEAIATQAALIEEQHTKNEELQEALKELQNLYDIATEDKQPAGKKK
jgi:hypothetical protein